MKLSLYCCKSKPYLYQGFAKPMHTLDRTNPFNYKWGLTNKPISNIKLNGKIVAECDFELEEIKFNHIHERDDLGRLHNEWWWEYQGLNIGNYQCELAKKSCLDSDDIMDYLVNKDGYAIHIKNLNVFNKPKELSEFYKQHDYKTWFPVNKAPKNIMNVDYINIEKKIFLSYFLIPIHPELLCKILNGECTIIVKKKVLKEMLK